MLEYLEDIIGNSRFKSDMEKHKKELDDYSNQEDMVCDINSIEGFEVVDGQKESGATRANGGATSERDYSMTLLLQFRKFVLHS